MTNKPIALQMYSLREESQKDFLGTLSKVAEMGYEGIEFAGYGELSAEELKRELDNLGLKAASSHVPLTTLEDETELAKIINYQHVIGSKNIVCPFLPPDRRSKEDYYNLIPILNRVGEQCFNEGINFSYHNHDFELIELENGKFPLELLLEETNPQWVQTEFDIYWLTKAGENPVEWINRYHNRTPLVHLKDMTTDGEQFFAELGTGGVDLDGVLKQASKSNVEWWVIEQDQSRRTPLESVKISLDYLKTKSLVND
ncbi:sugar phosphate isomerase/epimerase family protein [Oceanobacillus chungangensis]|uniref:Sugar phosphate isomerase/epimerase n=1 Tax=Oceanobacillus chungangensis TaxID=1229152 RepID=A0A3D8PKU6_9BACI|nr:sugar phosphate isomerase/epimerase [Oceanobacillus chungangensis]RDW16713.1 sugar phosphate isomerase/epimerase [Oceanobacillus chungangensis]